MTPAARDAKPKYTVNRGKKPFAEYFHKHQLTHFTGLCYNVNVTSTIEEKIIQSQKTIWQEIVFERHKSQQTALFISFTPSETIGFIFVQRPSVSSVT
ncbi:hypothetical protein llap_17844 [Limosa lapponica baueri]|uniref:Uncharacterized protein n=1 Tax=Limosa lapponica baueri TaxID=1758121 RepID=A0A2I0TDK2_LIMLA|nr:hypothetical protein llap_17844 [Limosa lapponica baueri]